MPPPAIVAAGGGGGCDRESLDDLFSRLDLAIVGTPGGEASGGDVAKEQRRDASTAGETSSSGLRSPGDANLDGLDYSDDDDSSAASAASASSSATNESARRLLRRARSRLDRQSLSDEVRELRLKVSRYESALDDAVGRKLELQNKCNDLETRLREAERTHRSREKKWADENAERERDHMNQLNDVCRVMRAKEEELTKELRRRDREIDRLRRRGEGTAGETAAAAGGASGAATGNIDDEEEEEACVVDLDDWDDDGSECSDFV